MKIVRKTKVADEFVETINRIISESFNGHFLNKGYRGDYKAGLNTSGSELLDGQLMEAQDLHTIARPTWGDTHYLSGVAGILGCSEVPHPDGSVIVVLYQPSFKDILLKRKTTRYERAAMKYAELYERDFGKEVKVILSQPSKTFRYSDDGLYWEANDFGFVSRR